MPRPISFKSRLNPEQFAATSHTRGPLLVLAGAGSGKTRVLTHRIAHLVLNEGQPPRSILAVTFTNKAAGEMAERVEVLLEEGEATGPGPSIGTFHSTCARLLRIHGAEIGLNPRFVIYDDTDQRSVLKRVLKGLEIETTPRVLSQFSARIDHFKNEGLDPDGAMEEAVGGEAEDVARVYQAYQLQLEKAGCLDFGDLLLQTLTLLRRSPATQRRLQRRWRYLMVDEFQDTNAVQYALLRMLTDPEEQNLCVVGDDDQSIYGWRGATVRNILDFKTHFPTAKTVKLEQNYRSTQTILDAAASVIDKLEERMDKRLWTLKSGGAAVEVFTGTSPREEASWVAMTLNKLINHQGLSSAQCAIFYRTNAQSRPLEEELRAIGLGYKMVGGQSFYSREEIKDILAYLKVAINPGDTVNLLRIINKPKRGIGKRTQEKLEHLTVLGLGPSTLFEAIEHAVEAKLFTGSRGAKLEAFCALVRSLTAGLRDGRRGSELAAELIQAIDYKAFLETKHANDSRERTENVLDLIDTMSDFEETHPALGVSDFLERSALFQQAEQSAPESTQTPISMMTVHASKGLEFDAVFVVGMEEGLFPMLRANSEPDIDEERRLCYVAMTRARRRLFVSNAKARMNHAQGQYTESRPSRFLADIPADLLEVSPHSVEHRAIWRSPEKRPPPQPSFDFDQRPQGGFKRMIRPQAPEEFDRHYEDDFDQRTSQERSPDPVSPAEEEDELVGKIVSHSREGIGEIIGVNGFGPMATLTVRFAKDSKEKKIVRKFVKVY